MVYLWESTQAIRCRAPRQPGLFGSKKRILTETPPNTGQTLLNKFILYEIKSKFYVVASNTNDSRHRMLKKD